MFTVAAIVFPKTVYLNIKSTQTVAIQDNNKKRFAIYLKTENGWFSERKIQRPVIKGMFCLRAGRWQHTSTCTIPKTDSTEGKWTHFLPWLGYKRNGKRCSCAAIELWIHLGGLLSTQEARVALGYTSSNSTLFLVLSNLPRTSITRWLHARRLPFLKCFLQTNGKLMHGNEGIFFLERDTEISEHLYTHPPKGTWKPLRR